MKTQILRLDPDQPDAAAIAAAAAVLRAGGLVAFPTETVYGLGADALNATAVQGIFAAKERPAYDPLIVHLAGLEGLRLVATAIPSVVEELAAHFWPGPLTLVLPRAEAVPSVVTAGSSTVAVRIPAHPIALALIQAAGCPVAAPSANRFGRLSPTCADDVLADLAGRIDLILDGGPTTVGVESTILSLVTPTPTILRPGGVSREALEAVMGPVALLSRPVVPAVEVAPAPGTLLQHYAPRARLILYQGAPAAMRAALREAAEQARQAGERVGLLLAEEDWPWLAGTSAVIQCVGPADAPAVIARRLFAALRRLDEAGVTLILARDFGAAGLGLAIRDRLTRAAGGHVVQVSG